MLRLFAFLEAYWWTLAFCVQTQHITMQMSDLKLLLSRHQAVLSHPDSFALNLFFFFIFFLICNFYLFIYFNFKKPNQQTKKPTSFKNKITKDEPKQSDVKKAQPEPLWQD